MNVSPLHLDTSVVTELEKHLVLCYTSKSPSGNLITTVRSLPAGRPQTVRRWSGCGMWRGDGALLKGQVGFGRLLQENRRTRSMPSITTSQIDTLRAAETSGAVGEKRPRRWRRAACSSSASPIVSTTCAPL